MQCGCFSVAGTGEVIREDRNLNPAKYRDILNENLVQSAQKLQLGWKFTFQQDNHPTHTAKAMQEWLRDDSNLNGPARVRTWNQSDILGETYKLLSTDGPQPTWQSLRWYKLVKKNKSRCAKLVAPYPKRPEAVIVANVL